MNTPVHQRCLLCGSDKLMSLKRYQRIHLVRCNSCHFIFSQKIPTEDELMKLYERYGRNDYLSPITLKRFHQILDHLEVYRQTNRMIDVGCGIGYFLEAAKERGWDVYGTEFTDEAVRICSSKQIKMQKGKLNPANYERDSFDVLISVEVMEHINNPVEEVLNFHSILRPNGVVYLTTPNFNSISRRFLHEKWNVLTYPEHLCYYTPQTISRLFSAAGFKKVNIETTGVSISRIKSSLSQTHETGISAVSEDEKLRRALELNIVLQKAKKFMNGILSLTGAGDNLKALFKKI